MHRLKVCGKIPKCDVCASFNIKNHVCNGKWCLDHKCYILTEEENLNKINKKAIKNTNGYIFFDYEAMQTSAGHKVNLVCARKICINCCNNENCELKLCGDLYWKTNEEFCEWLFSKENANFTAIPHNMTVSSY